VWLVLVGVLVGGRALPALLMMQAWCQNVSTMASLACSHTLPQRPPCCAVLCCAALCPAGASCKGGEQIASLPNFWRASPTSTRFYDCKARGVCLATNATGDEACREGQRGPLCDVCAEGHFKFAGTCRWVAAW